MTDIIPVKVAIRVRPLNPREIAENAKECLQCYIERSQVNLSGRLFTFDNVFDAATEQEVVYDSCAAPLVDKIFKGYNCTIFAYGQTGSGKTYTMGTEETSQSLESAKRGIVSRIVEAIFEQISDSTNYKVSVSMLEIHEEKVHDLLGTYREALHIREFKGDVFVQGLSSHQVDGAHSTMSELERGCRLRTKGETAMNDKSSRSHAVFTITIDKEALNEDDLAFKSKLHLVDLAGSERLKKTQAEGERMREGIKINEGLLALGNVIASLSEASSSNRHIPYRDSKITRLLQDSLGGNSYTVMIACVSPADSNAEETLSTLRYADRAKNIKNKPVVNIDPTMAIIERLKAELASAKHEILMLSNGGAVPGHRDPSSLDLVNKLDDVEKNHLELQEEHHKLKLRFAEAVAENYQHIENLLISEQTIENLREVIGKTQSSLRDAENIDPDAIIEMLNGSHTNVGGGGDGKTFAENLQADEEDSDENDEDNRDALNFADKQAVLGREIACLMEEIKNKEKAFEATTASHAEMEKMRLTYASEIKELQSKLSTLEQERNDLMKKLKSSSTHQKISEERRKRLLELEKELVSYKKRLAEIKRMEKENNNLQLQAKKLNTDLQELKKLRVRMAKQLKEEETKFRRWKVKADRELLQMKSRERKREMEAARAKQMFVRQLAVYRHKYEMANACNRRLQHQMLRSTDRKKSTQVDGQSTQAFLEDELAIAFSTAEAHVHCNILIEERKALSLQKESLEAKIACLSSEPPKKRRTGSNRSSIDGESDRQILEEQVKKLEEEIELRAAELRDLQSKCISADWEIDYDEKFNFLHLMPEAKKALKHLFSTAVNERRAVIEKDILVEEMKRKNREFEQERDSELEHLKKQIEEKSATMETLRRKVAALESRNAERGLGMLSALSAFTESRPRREKRTNDKSNELNSAEKASGSQNKFETEINEYNYDERNEQKPHCWSNRLRRRTNILGNISTYSGVEEDSLNDHTYLPTPERKSILKRSQTSDKRDVEAQKPMQMQSRKHESSKEETNDKKEKMNRTFTLKPADEEEPSEDPLLSSVLSNNRKIIQESLFDRI